MATKMITRTMTTYAYTFGRFNPATASVENIHTVRTVYKMNRKELASHTADGSTLLNKSEEQALYGVPLDVFLAHAVLLNPEDRKAMEGIESID